jgi:pyridoxine 4-dehydrogenase
MAACCQRLADHAGGRQLGAMTINTTAAAGGDLLLGGDLRVNRMGFGAMRLPAASFDAPVRDPQTGISVLRRAVELGVNHIDTAGFYARGEVYANELIRTALSPYPDDLMIATKVGPLRDHTGFPAHQASADRLRGLVEEDLRSLGLDRLDLVYLRIGGMSLPAGEPIGDRFAALAELREAGLIRHLGLSNVDAGHLAEARSIAPVAAVQNNFHVQQPDDVALLDRCAELGIAYVPFFPLGGGARPLDPVRLEEVAGRHGVTIRQVALAWLLAISPVTLAIPGTGSLDHLDENVAAAGVRLTPDDLRELAS